MREIILSSSVLIIAILAIRALLKGKIPARMQYALWLLVVVRLVMPGTIGNSPISVQHLRRFPTGTSDGTESEDMSAADQDSSSVGAAMEDTDAGISAYINGNVIDIDTNTDVNADRNTQVYTSGNSVVSMEENTKRNANPSVLGNDKEDAGPYDTMSGSAGTAGITVWKTIVFGIWILGIMITGGYMLLYQIRFARFLAVSRKPLQDKNREYRGLKVYTVEGLPSPCLCGRRIYTDSETVEDERRLSHILAHEYCHYRQLDSLWAYVRCMLVSLYWFHPLVWAAAYTSKRDSEFACDEAALKLLGEKERYEYGRTLLGLISPGTSKMSDIGPLLTMGSGEKGMRERIGRIAGKPKTYVAAGGLVIALAAVFAVITFTGEGRESLPELTQERDADAAANGATAQDEARMLAEQAEKVAAEADRLADEKEQLEQLIEDEKARKDEILQAEEELRRRVEELAEAERVMQVSQSVIGLLSPYDEMLLPVTGEGREGEIRELPEVIIRRPSALWEEYYSRGEDAIIEGLYLLASWNGREGQSMPQSVSDTVEDVISVYGLYTKEYGLRGVKIVVGEGRDKDVNNFDIPWSFVGNSRVHVLETDPEDAVPDGLPRTFAFIQLVPGSEEAYTYYGPETYELYLCDRYDTGHIEMSKVSNGEFILQIQDRISINYEEKKLYVYDSGVPVAVLDTSDFSVSDAESVKAVIDTDYIDFTFDSKLGNIRLDVPVELQIESENKNVRVWFPTLPFITFPIDCGYFGPDREFTLERARTNTFHVASGRYIELQSGREPGLPTEE